MALNCTMRLLCRRISLLKPSSETIGVSYYHDKPKNKKKVKAFQEAAEKERIEAHQKHAPIKSTIDADDLVSMIREQANQRNQTIQADTLLKTEVEEYVVPILDTVDLPYKHQQKKCVLCEHDVKLDYKVYHRQEGVCDTLSFNPNKMIGFWRDRLSMFIYCVHIKPAGRKRYLNVRLLSQFVSPYTGRIYGSSVTGLCHPMQSRVAKLINRARRLGLMPVMNKDPQFLNDPPLFKKSVFVK